MSSPATITLPASGFKNPSSICSETDFPTPLRPRMQSVSPGFTQKLTSFSTSKLPNDFDTFSNEI